MSTSNEVPDWDPAAFAEFRADPKRKALVRRILAEPDAKALEIALRVIVRLDRDIANRAISAIAWNADWKDQNGQPAPDRERLLGAIDAICSALWGG